MGAEARRAAGISDSLLRLSIGLEAEEDLIADLDAALSAASPDGASVVHVSANGVQLYGGE